MPKLLHHYQKGFSLLEIMIVIIIIGIGAASVRLAITSDDPLEKVVESVSAFDYWFTNQQQKSLMNSSEVGLFFTTTGFHVLQWRDGIESDFENEIVWESVNEISYAEKTPDLIVELILDNESQNWVELEDELAEDINDISPHVILFPSEEYEPSFSLAFYRDSYLDEQVLLVGDGFNSVEWQREQR